MLDKTKWWLTLGLAFLLTSLAVSGMLTYQAFYGGLPERPTRLSIEAVSLVSSLKDAETGQRGFLITGKGEYLEPYTASLPVIAQSQATLRRLTPKGNARVTEINRLTDLKLNELARLIALRRTEVDDPREIDLSRGKALMDQIRALAVRINGEEDHRVGIETAVQSAVSTLAITVILIVFCLFVAMRK